jgi:hypothetical protein
MDSYDHVWGIFITAAGKRRRLDVMIIPPDMWPYALLGWSGSKQYLRFLRQHAGNIGMNLNSHGLFRMVEVRAKPLALPPPAPPAASGGAATEPKGWSGAVGAGNGCGPRLKSSSISGTGVAAAAAGSSSLAEALNYVRASAAAGMSRAVLAVPDEAPPLDRNLKERWPHSWGPSAGSAATSAGVSGGGTADAGGSSSSVTLVGGVRGSAADGAHSGVDAEAATAAQQREALAALVHAGCGSGRAVASEADICELLGVPFRDPRERCC